MHLEPRNTERHHNIRNGVRLRKKVGYLAARLNVPLGNAECVHLLLGIAGELAASLDLALTHGLHGLKRQRRLHALLDEVEHDIVTAADGLVNGGDVVDDEVADIARPNIGAVGEAGQAHQRIKLRRLRLNKHLTGKAGAELGDAYAAGLTDDGVIVW